MRTQILCPILKAVSDHMNPKGGFLYTQYDILNHEYMCFIQQTIRLGASLVPRLITHRITTKLQLTGKSRLIFKFYFVISLRH